MEHTFRVKTRIRSLISVALKRWRPGRLIWELIEKNLELTRSRQAQIGLNFSKIDTSWSSPIYSFHLVKCIKSSNSDVDCSAAVETWFRYLRYHRRKTKKSLSFKGLRSRFINPTDKKIKSGLNLSSLILDVCWQRSKQTARPRLMYKYSRIGLARASVEMILFTLKGCTQIELYLLVGSIIIGWHLFFWF